MSQPRTRAGRDAALSPEERAAKADLRRRSAQVSSFSLQAMTWVVLLFYSTDYVPALTVSNTVGLQAPRPLQYLVGYLCLSAVCVLVAGAFGVTYGARIHRSRYVLRWYLLPPLVAALLVPAQGINPEVSKVVELASVLAGVGLGAAVSRPVLARLRGRGRGAES